MVQFVVTTPSHYDIQIKNRLDNELPYDITDLDPSISPGAIPPRSDIQLRIHLSSVPVIDPCVKLLTLPYSYGRPVFVEFSQDATSSSIQNIDLTEMPGFTMVENNMTVDHISEFGHHVKLSGGTTDTICLEVWCDATQ
jgi:hypothetical protein